MRKFKITVDNRIYEVAVEEISGTSVAGGAAVSAPAPVPVAQAAPVTAAPAAAPAPVPAAAATGGNVYKSPMPGMVIKYLTQDGAAVKKGQAVLVLEAMKMENDIKAPSDGTIKFIASAGSQVSTGAPLFTIFG